MSGLASKDYTLGFSSLNSSLSCIAHLLSIRLPICSHYPRFASMQQTKIKAEDFMDQPYAREVKAYQKLSSARLVRGPESGR